MGLSREARLSFPQPKKSLIFSVALYLPVRKICKL
jgi:hypothetical protein